MKKIFTLITTALLGGVMCANAQNSTYILDINQMYTDASTASGQLTGATLNSGSKYLLNTVDYVQDIFTVRSNSNRTYRIDLFDPENPTKKGEYGDYTATARLEPNGASNKATGGRQMFVEVTNKGALFIGAWTGTEGRKLVVAPANDKTSYVDITSVTPLLEVSLQKVTDETKTNIYGVDLESGLYCITQDNGIYYGYVKFVEGATATGISSITTDTAANANAPIYNLAGQQVTKSYKGVCIQNGKKFINK